jgi:hypothetical protein
VDDRVHAADRVDLVGDASSLDGAAQVANDEAFRVRSQIGDGRRAFTIARVQNDLMTLADERRGGRPPQSVCAAGDKNASHLVLSEANMI